MADGDDGRDDEIGGSGSRGLQRRNAKPGTILSAKRQRFLEVLAATANVRRAAAAAGAATNAFYRLRARDAAFAAQWQGALDAAVVRLEGDLLARALGAEGRAGVEDGDGDGDRDGDGDGDESGGGAATVDPKLALELLKRFDAKPRGGCQPAVAARRQVSIEEVGRVLARRLTALGKRGAA